MEAILNVENVSVQFGVQSEDQWVLRDISFSVRRGEMLAIIGESGCGKTVLLKTLIGLHNQASGTILFDGIELKTLTYFELAKVRTRWGFVFQHAALFDSMTIGDNIAFPLVQHTKKPKKEILDIVLTLIEEVGLDHTVLNKKPAELSGGMRKRAGIARALALEPELILYDEPTTGLDPVMSSLINELMVEVRRQHNVTGIMVTHDLRSARTVADRIIMLAPLAKLEANEPQIVFDGTPRELYSSPNLRVRRFIKAAG
ncbi:MAG: ATP-binding cassette domain-containing protein [Planctomycetaceae bacterium]|nr:ATP-binding cassette domain-containing protein [Planctomycetaceae bacterium]